MVSSTISGWIKNFLREAGIYIKTSTSISKVRLAGLSVTGILERSSWTNASTWQRFYNRQVSHLQKNTKMKFQVKNFEQEEKNGLEYDKRA